MIESLLAVIGIGGPVAIAAELALAGLGLWAVFTFIQSKNK